MINEENTMMTIEDAKFYITSQGGCISTKGFFKDNLTTKDGNIDVWEDEASALRSIEIVRETWENNLANKKKAVKLTDDSFIHLYERWIKGLEKDLKWLDTCVVKELRYNNGMNDTVGKNYIANKGRDTLRKIVAVSPRVVLTECKYKDIGWRYELWPTEPTETWLNFSYTAVKVADFDLF